MKKILVALDYNPSAEKVALTAQKIGKAMGAEVTLMHVITDPAYYAMEYSPIMGFQGTYTTNTINLIEDIKTEAEKFLSATVKHLGDDQVKTAVLEGDAKEVIVQYSKDISAELIVMGSHSHTGLEKLFGTDTAAYVLKHSTVPLLCIPTED